MHRNNKGFAAAIAAMALFALQLVPAAWAQDWTPIAPRPVAGDGAAAAGLGNNLHVIGGFRATSCASETRHDVFDTSAGTWSTRAPMTSSSARNNAVAVAAGGKLYVIGGRAQCEGATPRADVDIYDPATDSWSSGAPMPAGRFWHAAASLGGKIYVAGGSDELAPRATLFIYDIATNTWATGAPLPRPRTAMGAVAFDGRIYVVGRVDPADRDVIVYDPATDTWSSRPSVAPALRFGAQAALLDGFIYLLGGLPSPVLNVLNSVDRYDPVADVWQSSAAMTSRRWNFAAASVNGAIYAVGGQTFLGGGSTASAERFGGVPADTTPPSVTASASPAPNAAGWNDGNVAVALSATDEAGGSGVAQVNYTIVNGASTNPNVVPGDSASFTVSDEGVNTITFSAMDEAGNVSASQALVVRVDKTPPSGALALTPNVLWPPNNKMVTIQVSLSTSDASGPVSVSAPVVTSNQAPSAAGDWEFVGDVIRLRAARDPGTVAPRVYTISFTLTDLAGNTTPVSATVTVPHDLRK